VFRSRDFRGAGLAFFGPLADDVVVGGDQAATGAFLVLVRRGDFLLVRMVAAHRAFLLRHGFSLPLELAYGSHPIVATLVETLLAVNPFRFASDLVERL
jgi:hypothetical protein